MNKQPVSYTQTDPRWAGLSYSVQGENSTIGDSGCGPTCAAMLLTSLMGQEITPVAMCKWSVAHGYKVAHRGTDHGYFVRQFKAYGVECRQLTAGAVYGQPDAPVHREALALLNEGWYLIALMGPGLWTHGGHYVVLWWADNKIRINDPASTREQRVNGDPAVFLKQVKHYWAVDARAHNMAGDDDDMTDEAFAEKMSAYLNNLAGQGPSDWGTEACQSMVEAGLFRGDEAGRMRYRCFVTQETLAVVLHRLLERLDALPTEKPH